ncbi:molecular chaperone [Xenorhabdus sp. M]|uniref:Molecular chaperone n=2 Tax=Xenorhabdus szentirmaii TaxID=290112 RepID=A0AAW3YQN1_9GAMM|nr:molecular chaperone [Xenorhabdus sp. M]
MIFGGETVVSRYRILSFVFLYFLYFLCCNFSIAGVVIGGTRVIYLSNKKEVSISISNPEKDVDYLIQSWIQDDNNKTKTPFIVTPPLFKLSANNENILRIVRVGNDLPLDRESLLWLNIKTIPGSFDLNENTNQLYIVVNSKLKLFYRPDQLKKDADIAHKLLKFKQNNGLLIAENPTPYFISFSSLNVDDHDIKQAGMIKPFGQMSWPLPLKNAKKVSWKVINDYGGTTQAETANIQIGV